MFSLRRASSAISFGREGSRRTGASVNVCSWPRQNVLINFITGRDYAPRLQSRVRFSDSK